MGAVTLATQAESLNTMARQAFVGVDASEVPSRYFQPPEPYGKITAPCASIGNMEWQASPKSVTQLLVNRRQGNRKALEEHAPPHVRENRLADRPVFAA